jgi:RNA-binding protein YhbY
MNDFDNNLSKKFKRNLIKAEFETIANETLTENIDTIIDKIDKTLFLRLNENERAHLRNDIVNSIRASVTKNGTIKISVLHR